VACSAPEGKRMPAEPGASVPPVGSMLPPNAVRLPCCRAIRHECRTLVLAEDAAD
jgi:hypothetical protein